MKGAAKLPPARGAELSAGHGPWPEGRQEAGWPQAAESATCSSDGKDDSSPYHGFPVPWQTRKLARVQARRVSTKTTGKAHLRGTSQPQPPAHSEGPAWAAGCSRLLHRPLTNKQGP